MSTDKTVTVITPINIAFIKYWGKVDETLIIPTNDSFSITLSTNQFRTKTSIAASTEFAEDKLYLNGEEEELKTSGRLHNVLSAYRAALPEDRRAMKYVIVSENNFPTAAGMASSAAGLSALAYGLTTLHPTPIDVSILARIGSGSACRSVMGGFVKWVKGTQSDGTDCKAVQHITEKGWPNMNILCLVTKADKKDVSSTVGMRRAVENSPLMAERISTRVPERMELISEAVTKNDFETFALITMTDCEDFRAVCRSSEPIVDYWNDKAEKIIALVKAFNDAKGRLCAAYTYDAGANAFIFVEDSHLDELVAYFLYYFPMGDAKTSKVFFEDVGLLERAEKVDLNENLKSVMAQFAETDGLTFMLHSKVGAGPTVLDTTESLVANDGEVKK